MLLKGKIILDRSGLILNSISIAPFNSSINAGFVPNARILAVASESRAVFSCPNYKRIIISKVWIGDIYRYILSVFVRISSVYNRSTQLIKRTCKRTFIFDHKFAQNST